MRSVRIQFKRIKLDKPDMDDLNLLSLAVQGQKYTRKTLAYNLRLLVNKNEYLPCEKKDILNELQYWTNLAEDGQKTTWACIKAKQIALSRKAKKRPDTSITKTVDGQITPLQIVKQGIYSDLCVNNIIKRKTPASTGVMSANI